MSEDEAYRRIYSDNIDALRRGEVEIDPFLFAPGSDQRMGLSLIAPLPALGKACAGLVRAFREAEPGQYYYPPGDLHVTVFDFIAGTAGYERDAGLEARIEGICDRAAASMAPVDIGFRGLVLGRAAGLLKGYSGGRLGALREALRRELAEAGIPSTERYRSTTAHATFCRFASPLQDPAGLCALAEAWSEAELCAERRIVYQLLEHDWYNRASKRRLVSEYRP